MNAGRRCSYSVMASTWRSDRPMSSQPFRRRSRVNSSEREGGREPGRRCLEGAAGDVDGDLERGVLCHRGQQGMVELGRDLDREQPLLGAVVAEDVGETRGDDRLEAVVHEGPHGVLAGGAGAEVVARHQDVGAGVFGVVEDEVTVVAPFGEQSGPEAGALDRLSQSDGMIWSVSTSVRSRGTARPVTMMTGFIGRGPRGWRSVPATAVAAATVGETRWVRPPRP